MVRHSEFFQRKRAKKSMTPKLTNDGRPGEEPNGAVMKVAA